MLSETEIKNGIEGNQRRNYALLSVLSKKGIELDAIRLIDYHFWSFDRRDAAMLARELYRHDYLILSIAPVEQDGEKSWSIEAQMEHCPQDAASLDRTKTLSYLAAKFDSIYDGWGTKI